MMTVIRTGMLVLLLGALAACSSATPTAYPWGPQSAPRRSGASAVQLPQPVLPPCTRRIAPDHSDRMLAAVVGCQLQCNLPLESSQYSNLRFTMSGLSPRGAAP